MLTIKRSALVIAAPLALALSACGGGGGGSAASPVPDSSYIPPASSPAGGSDSDTGRPDTGDVGAGDQASKGPAAGDTGSNGPMTNECDAAKPEWIWCDDFETDRIASYFEASMPREAGVGVNGSQGVVGRYLVGTSEAGNLKLAFGRTPSGSLRPADDGTRNYREVYWRVYVKHPSDWEGGGADKLSRATVFTGSDWRQAMIAHVWSSRSDGDAYLKLDPASGVSGSSVRTSGYNDFDNLTWLGARRGATPLFSDANKGKWHCVEARVKLNEAGQSNGVFQLWVNGELDVSRTDLNWIGSYNGYGINAVFLENYWNAGTQVEQSRYMDNFVVSTAPIGC